MTPEQRTALIAACDQGDDVKAVTCALAITASAARCGYRDHAQRMRAQIDAHQSRGAIDTEYLRTRLQIAARYYALQGVGAEMAVGMADELLRVNAASPIPAEWESA